MQKIDAEGIAFRIFNSCSQRDFAELVLCFSFDYFWIHSLYDSQFGASLCYHKSHSHFPIKCFLKTVFRHHPCFMGKLMVGVEFQILHSQIEPWAVVSSEYLLSSVLMDSSVEKQFCFLSNVWCSGILRIYALFGIYFLSLLCNFTQNWLSP